MEERGKIDPPPPCSMSQTRPSHTSNSRKRKSCPVVGLEPPALLLLVNQLYRAIFGTAGRSFPNPRSDQPNSLSLSEYSQPLHLSQSLPHTTVSRPSYPAVCLAACMLPWRESSSMNSQSSSDRSLSLGNAPCRKMNNVSRSP